MALITSSFEEHRPRPISANRFHVIPHKTCVVSTKALLPYPRCRQDAHSKPLSPCHSGKHVDGMTMEKSTSDHPMQKRQTVKACRVLEEKNGYATSGIELGERTIIHFAKDLSTRNSHPRNPLKERLIEIGEWYPTCKSRSPSRKPRYLNAIADGQSSRVFVVASFRLLVGPTVDVRRRTMDAKGVLSIHDPPMDAKSIWDVEVL